ncbi:membrane protein [Shewanella mangrovi]|uniref:Outer membrane protein W n=1 Tax=Shewanella mangrovi TaxID=1515746 RepID=A0A094LSF2_9GAMM|nr:outer membrane protein OmpW [Shewanella mangrovi]KFZ38123.1 membrane protein [Shewanella mangrovi]
MDKKIISGIIAAALFSAAGAATAHEAGDIIVRAGAAVVAPNESSDHVVTPDLGDLGEFDVSNNTQLGLNFGYMLTDNIGVELLAASPFSHDVKLAGVGKIAETKHLPPTLVVQYYFGDAQSKVRPYIGAGVNYTNFFDTKFTNDLGGKLSNLSMENSWGLAGQVGIDYQVTDKLLVNASIWYAQIDSDVSFDYAYGDNNENTAAVTIGTDIDPWVYMVSVGYVF